MATSAKTEEYDPQLDDMIRESATENSLTEIAKSTGAIPKKRSLLNPPRPESKDHSLGSSKQGTVSILVWKYNLILLHLRLS